jgi:hypothetical protein
VRRSLALALGIACTLATAACAGTQATHTAELKIRFYPRGQDEPGARTYRLTCGPASGTVPHPKRACTRLLALKNPFAPVPRNTICSDIALGPQTALVTGHVRKQRIWARLRLVTSCQIDRWRRVAAVVPGFPAGRPG